MPAAARAAAAHEMRKLPLRRERESGRGQAEGGARDGVAAAADGLGGWAWGLHTRSVTAAVRWGRGRAAARTATVPVASRQATQCVSTGQPSSVWKNDSSATAAHIATRTRAAATRNRVRTNRLRTARVYAAGQPARRLTK